MAIVGSTKFGRGLSKRFAAIDNRMSELYGTTYASRPDNKKDLDRISGDIIDTLDNMISSADVDHVSDLSNLYFRLQKKNGVPNDDLIKNTMELFSDTQVINTLAMSSDVLLRSVQAENYQYDLICKYMTKLEDALNIKKDNILSSDNFTKEFMNVKSDKYSDSSNSFFYQRVKATKSKYKLPSLYERMVREAEKYGECFVYCVPYEVAIQRLLNNRGNKMIMNESNFIHGETVIFESSMLNKGELKENNAIQSLMKSAGDDISVNLRFSEANCLIDKIQSCQKSKAVLESVSSLSLTEAYNVLSEEARAAMMEGDEWSLKSVYDKKVRNKGLSGSATDGLIIPGATKGTNQEKVKNLGGAVLSVIPRENIIPIYISDDLCVGYYHFNFHNSQFSDCCHLNRGTTTSMSTGFMGASGEFDNGIDELVNFIARQMSGAIDAKFVNANKDLKEEIYAVLRHNDQFDVLNGTNDITVTFIPADDIEHFYFEMDPNTHRGISDLKKSLVPAMMYCLLYLTDTIGQVTRAQDKRIYYVKQNVETNVARSMMNVINQLKKGNMGMREISSMNTILNIVGKYNDHVIPLGPSGDPPVQFEVMSGQDIKTPTELMERFEESAVSVADVPLEFIQSVNQVDYATRFTMSNSKFLRKIFKRQRTCQGSFSRIFTKVYNYEWGENEREIKVMLPAPAFLMMTNSEQLMANTKNYVDAIVDVELSDEDETVKNIFRRKMMKSFLGSYLDYDQIDEFIIQSRFESKVFGGSSDEE